MPVSAARWRSSLTRGRTVACGWVLSSPSRRSTAPTRPPCCHPTLPFCCHRAPRLTCVPWTTCQKTSISRVSSQSSSRLSLPSSIAQHGIFPMATLTIQYSPYSRIRHIETVMRQPLQTSPWAMVHYSVSF